MQHYFHMHNNGYAAARELAAGYHSHSRSSKAFAVGGSSSSSPAARMARAAVSQPSRGVLVARTTSRPGSACNSTSSGNSA